MLDRKGPDGDFYKALIQLAGAFVHLQKARLQPCIALLRLTRNNVVRYPTIHHQLDLDGVKSLIDTWEARVTGVQEGAERSDSWHYPRLQLRE